MHDNEVLELALRVNGGEEVVRVSGEIDMHTGPVLRAALLAALELSRRVVIDLRAVSFVDSSGVRAILEAWHAYQDVEDTPLTLAGPLRPAVQKVFDMVGLTEILSVADADDESPDG